MIWRALMVCLAILIVAAASIAFAWLFSRWHGLAADRTEEIFVIFVLAACAASILCLAGQLLGIRSLAYYLIVAGAAFLAADFCIWFEYGIMPGRKVFRDGFVPAAIMGLFLGPLYRAIAMPVAKTEFLH